MEMRKRNKMVKKQEERRKDLVNLAELIWLLFRSLDAGVSYTVGEILSQSRRIAGKKPGSILLITWDMTYYNLRDGSRRGLVSLRKNKKDWSRDRFCLRERCLDVLLRDIEDRLAVLYEERYSIEATRNTLSSM